MVPFQRDPAGMIAANGGRSMVAPPPDDSLGKLVLALNGGSSSLKFSLGGVDGGGAVMCGSIGSIGAEESAWSLRRKGQEETRRSIRCADLRAGAAMVLEQLRSDGLAPRIAVVGHRVVHGGAASDGPRRIDARLIGELRELRPLDPDHLPAELSLIEALSEALPKVPQVASFDTVFHRTMDRLATLLPIPREYAESGVRRYGFHGLSYTFLIEELGRIASPEEKGRVILAHLGSGASLAAVHLGLCVDTTMGFTPTGGIPMSTRSGDLDPGVLLWLLRNEKLDVDALDDLVNHRSGLRGLSQTTGDMQQLLAREPEDLLAREAVNLFCRQVTKAIGALATTIGGVDTLVFAGGIGERSPLIRARIAEPLQHLGIRLDVEGNQKSAPVISSKEASCTVRVIATDEESIVAREAVQVLQHGEREGERR